MGTPSSPRNRHEYKAQGNLRKRMEKRKSTLTTHAATWISRNDDLVTEIWYWYWYFQVADSFQYKAHVETSGKVKIARLNQSKTGKEKEIEMVLQDPVMEVGE